MVTIRDVARAARVSVATVSRVQNESSLVTEPTRRRVRSVARRLGYTPHAAARSLSTRRTSSIGVLLPDLYGEFYAELIRGIDQTAQRQGYHLLIASSHNDRATIEAALQAMRGRVDGLILMSPGSDAHLPVRDLPERFPVVLLSCNASSRSFDSMVVANRQGAFEMVRHLLSRGHRRIAMITGPSSNFDAVERWRGYRAALESAKVRRVRQYEALGDFTQASGFEACRKLLGCEPRPTAIFAGNDAMAIGALSALAEAGVQVPGEIAVAGFDDIPMARYMHPPLSTVRVDINALGERAAKRLLDAVGNGRRHHHRRETLPVTLVIRESCGGRGQPAASSPRRQEGIS